MNTGFSPSMMRLPILTGGSFVITKRKVGWSTEPNQKAPNLLGTHWSNSTDVNLAMRDGKTTNE
jgi:hypothetical protein